jgi:hypothetical protein
MKCGSPPAGGDGDRGQPHGTSRAHGRDCDAPHLRPHRPVWRHVPRGLPGAPALRSQTSPLGSSVQGMTGKEVGGCGAQDKVGPFCRAASDCALILDILRGHDPDDIAAQDVGLPSPFDVAISNFTLGVLPSVQTTSAEVMLFCICAHGTICLSGVAPSACHLECCRLQQSHSETRHVLDELPFARPSSCGVRSSRRCWRARGCA